MLGRLLPPEGSIWRTHGLMLLVAMAWGGAFPAIKVALDHLPPVEVALGRFLVAAVPFALVLAWRGIPSFTPREWVLVGGLAALAVPVYHVGLNWGEQFTPAGTASLLVASGPVWGALLSAGLGRERLTTWKAGGVVVALAGVVLLVLRGRPEGADLGLSYTRGALAILLAAVSWAAYTVLSKPLLHRHGALPYVATVSLLGTFLLLPTVGGFPERVVAGGLALAVALLFLGLVASFLGVSGYITGLQHLTPTETMVYIYLVPVFALLWSYLLLGEVLTVWALLGGGLVVLGVAATHRGRHARPKEPRASAGESKAAEKL